MQIWVDADACPNVIKEILFRSAERLQVTVTLVANQLIRTPPSLYIKALQVPRGFDVADNKIAELVQPGDLVITADIPLAADVLARGGHVLDPRGEVFTKDNIRERLSMRDFMDGLRASGVDTGGPAPFAQSDRQAFANRLDRFLVEHRKESR
ncbi:MAG: YaiI/YqxD family protein [Pseudomonadota bacterium]